MRLKGCRGLLNPRLCEGLLLLVYGDNLRNLRDALLKRLPWWKHQRQGIANAGWTTEAPLRSGVSIPIFIVTEDAEQLLHAPISSSFTTESWMSEILQSPPSLLR